MRTEEKEDQFADAGSSESWRDTVGEGVTRERNLQATAY